MTHAPQSTDRAGAERAPCFLCRMEATRCQVTSVTGTIVGARVEGHGARATPVLGLDTTELGRVRINLGPDFAGLVERLAGLVAEDREKLKVRALHLREGQANPPAPGQQPFRVLHALPATVVIVQPDLLLNITDLTQGAYCVRQEVLRDLFPMARFIAGVRGTMIHAVFKELLKDDAAEAEPVLAVMMQAARVDLAEMDASETEIRAEIAPHLASLGRWRDEQRGGADSPRQVRAETFLLAPEIGLKGRLDILVEDSHSRRLLELKTGRVKTTEELPKQDHRWQVQGYHALLAVREGVTNGAPLGTLLYSDVPGTALAIGIPPSLREMQRMLALRNEIALVRITGTVPAPPGGAKCARCVRRAQCSDASSLLAWQPPPNDAPPPPAPDRDAAWFRRWWGLLRLESHAADAATHTLWRKTAAERIAAGSAIGDLVVLDPPVEDERHEWIYTFRCENLSELREGDEILLSDGDPVRGQVVSGTILHLAAERVTVWAREQISHPALIDRYSADVVNRRMQHNLTRWLRVDERLQTLVRGETRPRFDPEAPPVNPALLAGLNREQADAVLRALTMKDYLIVQGPPGTGKTAVIAAITRALVGRGFRVALAAFTNQATDTMLRRVVEGGVASVLRLGHRYAVAEDLAPFRLMEHATRRAGHDPGAAEIRETLRAAPVVAATVATWSAERYEVEDVLPSFDVVIVDEATQLTVPATLGALRWARKFILVGDEHQLAPLVQSLAARANGLGESLFEQLLPHAPAQARIALRRQYRMHEQIAAFPSRMFYSGALVADASVAGATLAITPTRFTRILDPALPLVWAETPPAPVATKLNDREARAAADLARALVESGLPPDAIGIIAPFRAQAARLRQHAGDLVPRGLTVDTVDRFQGGERRVILLSLTVAAPPSEEMATFLSDPRRLNVALTRAREKLIILGNRAAVADLPWLGDLAAHCADLVMPWN